MVKSSGHNNEVSLKSADWHKLCVYKDAEFLGRVKTLRKLEVGSHTYDKELESIAAYFAISIRDIRVYLMSTIIPGTAHGDRRSSMSFDLEKRQFTFTFDFSIKKAEFLSRWEQLSAVRNFIFGKAKERERAPGNYPLVYAIFKARKSKTFREIFDLYSGNKLPGFKGSTTQYTSEDDLERFYHKYDPSKTGS